MFTRLHQSLARVAEKGNIIFGGRRSDFRRNNGNCIKIVMDSLLVKPLQLKVLLLAVRDLQLFRALDGGKKD